MPTKPVQDKPEKEETLELPPTPAPVPVEIGPAQMTLPELAGAILRRALEDPKTMPECKRDFRIWYNAQDPHDRKTIARKAKLDMERSRSIIESIFQEFMSLAFPDLA